MIDEDGDFTYSPIVLMRLPADGFRMSILSNPITRSYAELSVYTPRSQTGEIIVLDNWGRSIRKIQISFIKGNNILQVDLEGLGAGQYYLYFNSATDRSAPCSFIKS